MHQRSLLAITTQRRGTALSTDGKRNPGYMWAIAVMKRHVRVKHLKMFRAKEKLRTIEGEQQQMRDSLRRTIQ